MQPSVFSEILVKSEPLIIPSPLGKLKFHLPSSFKKKKVSFFANVREVIFQT